MSIIDISVPLRKGMPVWPGSVAYEHEQTRSISRGDQHNLSNMRIDMHMGTHIDAPLHFLEGGDSVDMLDLELFCGLAFVADLTGADAVGERELSALGLPEGVERILLKTRNSFGLWDKPEFDEGFVALTLGGAEWLVEKGVRMVGNDYLSVQRFSDGPGVHHALLGSGVGVLEGVALGHVEPGEYELICLPLKVVGAEGAPARAALRRAAR